MNPDLAIEVLFKCYTAVWPLGYTLILGKAVSGFGKHKSKLRQVNFIVLCQ